MTRERCLGLLLQICIVPALVALSGCSRHAEEPGPSTEVTQWATSRSHGKSELLRIAARFFDEDEPQNSASYLPKTGRHLLIPPEVKKLNLRMTVIYWAEEFEVDPEAKSVNVPPECELVAWVQKPVAKDQLEPLRWFDGVELNTNEKSDVDAILASLVPLNPMTLVFNNCILRAKEIAQINAMPALRTMILRGVELQDVAALKPLPQLHRLDCKDGRPEEAIGSLLLKCRNLDYLSLRGFLVDSSASDAICKMKHLAVLDLPDTGLDDMQLQRILEHVDLKRLSVHNTAVTDEAARIVGGQSRLEMLNLSRCAISDAFAPTLSRLKELRNLDLSKTDFSDDGVRIISTLPKLGTLGLTNTKITEKALPYLPSLKSLHTLALDDNDMPIKPLRSLQKRMANCSIH